MFLIAPGFDDVNKKRLKGISYIDSTAKDFLGQLKKE